MDKIVKAEYDLLDLKCLSQIQFCNEHSLSFFSHYLEKVKPINSFHSYKFYNELSFISDDLKYYTAITYLLRPYINNPLREEKTYHQTLEDKRYLSYASILFQCFYNYWDRIGDLIYCFIETPLKEKEVYFHSVLQKINEKTKDSEYYLELNNLYNEKLSNLFKKRKEIVHYFQLSTESYAGTFINYDDEEKLEKDQESKESLPDFFKENIDYTFQGFELAIKFINQKGVKK